MARLIVSEFVTLDGVMEAPGGEPGHPHTGWVFDYADSDWTDFKLEEVLEAETLLVGRVTYESFAGAWPSRSGELADKLNAMPKIVASTTLRDPGWSNSSVISGDVAEAVRGLKERAGGPILVHGSRTLVHALVAAGLVDEYRLLVFPVVLGSGGRLFPETPDKTVLELAGTRTFSRGVVLQTYRASA
jgi:dihydrofolate reductase